jgi:hypothetical protein
METAASAVSGRVRGTEHTELLKDEDVRRWHENVAKGSEVTADMPQEARQLLRNPKPALGRWRQLGGVQYPFMYYGHPD